MARTRTSERERAQTRARILGAASSVFTERGYRGATLDAIARAAELSRAGLLHHFASKEELLLALLDARDAELGLGTGTGSTRAMSATDCSRSCPRGSTSSSPAAAWSPWPMPCRRGVGARTPCPRVAVTRYARLRDHLTDAFESSPGASWRAGRSGERARLAVAGHRRGARGAMAGRPRRGQRRDGMEALHALILGAPPLSVAPRAHLPKCRSVWHTGLKRLNDVRHQRCWSTT